MSGPGLLFDHNLPPRLVRVLADLYLGCPRVRDLGLERVDDETIRLQATRRGFAIVRQDDDFRQRSFVRGPSSR